MKFWNFEILACSQTVSINKNLEHNDDSYLSRADNSDLNDLVALIRESIIEMKNEEVLKHKFDYEKEENFNLNSNEKSKRSYELQGKFYLFLIEKKFFRCLK